MSQTLTSRVKAIKNTPGTGEFVDVSEINSAFDKFDNHFIPSCKMENTAVQSIASGGSVQLQYNVVIHDSYAARAEGAMADLINDQITIRKAGLYKVFARIWTTTSSATGVMFLGIYKNGSGMVADQMVPGASTITQEVHSELVLAVNDVLICQAIQTSGGARNYTKNTWPDGFIFGATWLGSVVEV